jgi:hypothetical protein
LATTTLLPGDVGKTVNLLLLRGLHPRDKIIFLELYDLSREILLGCIRRGSDHGIFFGFLTESSTSEYESGYGHQ